MQADDGGRSPDHDDVIEAYGTQTAEELAALGIDVKAWLRGAAAAAPAAPAKAPSKTLSTTATSGTQTASQAKAKPTREEILAGLARQRAAAVSA